MSVHFEDTKQNHCFYLKNKTRPYHDDKAEFYFLNKSNLILVYINDQQVPSSGERCYDSNINMWSLFLRIYFEEQSKIIAFI